ncbi:CoA transferase [Desulfosarcina cetonica]|uniref:CoA transferase n=1 Tax=Desulfosarcina cetonica TaxID=90730 RepID=UPI000AD819DC|nr:CoA transferase [Desulfosarcina cetonica]
MGSNKVMWDPFAQWMQEENIEEWEAFQEDCWIEPAYRKSKAGYERFCRIFERYTLQQDKLTLYEKGQAHRVALTPVSNGKDLLENPQLNYRGFWQTLHHDNLGGDVTYPGAPYEFGEIQWRMGSPAPTFGQHTAEIMRELGYDQDQIENLAKEGIIHVG